MLQRWQQEAGHDNRKLQEHVQQVRIYLEILSS
jgi:hypothetical protein